MKVSKIHKCMTSIRKAYLDTVLTEIIKKHDVISLEDLQASNMLKKVLSQRFKEEKGLVKKFLSLEIPKNYAKKVYSC